MGKRLSSKKINERLSIAYWANKSPEEKLSALQVLREEHEKTFGK